MELDLARIGVQKAQAERDDSLPGLVRALALERARKARRLNRINRLLKRGRLSKATRTRLLEEKAGLVGEIGDLEGTLNEYRADAAGGATTISQAEKLDAGVAPETDSATAEDPLVRLTTQLVELTAEKNARDARLEKLLQQQGPALAQNIMGLFSVGVGHSTGRLLTSGSPAGVLARA